MIQNKSVFELGNIIEMKYTVINLLKEELTNTRELNTCLQNHRCISAEKTSYTDDQIKNQ